MSTLYRGPPGGPLLRVLISFRSINKHGRHRQFLFLIGRFLKIFSEKNFKNQPIRNQNRLWWPCLLMDRDGMSNLYRGRSIDAFYQVSVHLAISIKSTHFVPIPLNIDTFCIYSKCSFLWIELQINMPLKPLNQINWNLVGTIYGGSSIKFALNQKQESPVAAMLVNRSRWN
jgi:hypothetical protein